MFPLRHLGLSCKTILKTTGSLNIQQLPHEGSWMEQLLIKKNLRRVSAVFYSVEWEKDHSLELKADRTDDAYKQTTANKVT